MASSQVLDYTEKLLQKINLDGIVAKFKTVEKDIAKILKQEQNTQLNYWLIGGVASATLVAGYVYAQLRYPKKGDASLVRPDRELLHDKFAPSKVPQDLDVIIIGSGMGGLSCAAILARLGQA
jgi:hypothetical protein